MDQPENKFSLREDTKTAAAIFAASLLFSYGVFLFNPGSLFFRVVRDFWPLYHTWPYFELSKRIFAEGHFPLWNPLNACGIPLLGDMQPAPFHPARLIMFLFPFRWVIDIWLLTRIFLTGLGTFWFLRHRGVGWQGSVLGGCAWMFCGSITDYINLHYLDIDLLLPYGLLAFGRMARSFGIMPILFCSLFIFLAILGGNPTSSLFLFIFVTLYYFSVVYKMRKDVPGYWIRFACAAILSVLISAIVLLPFQEALSFSWNYHPPGLWSVSLKPEFFLSIFGPEIYTSLDTRSAPLIQRLPYIGTVILVVALPSLIYLKRIGSGASFLAAFVLFFAGVIWGVLPFKLFNYLPLFIRTSNFRYVMPEVSFCVALLAGMTWDRLRRENGRFLFFLPIPMLLTLVSVGLIAGKYYNAIDFPVRGSGLMMSCMFAWGAFILLTFQQKNIVGKQAAFFAILAIWIIEAGVHFRYLPMLTPGDPFFQQTKSGADLNIPKNQRIYATENMLKPNVNMVAELEDIRYFGALFPSRYRRFMSILNSQSENEELNDFIPYNFIRIDPRRIESPALNLLGVNSIISNYKLPPNKSIQKLLVNGDIEAPDKKNVLQKSVFIDAEQKEILFEHPPAMISDNMPRGIISFGIGVDPDKWKLSRDGMTFMIIKYKSGRARCIFSKHTSPRTNDFDRRWLNFSVAHTGGELSFVTLPLNNIENDWSGWSDLRSTGIEGDTRYKFEGGGAVNVYSNSQAMPRAFLVGTVDVKNFGECAIDLDNTEDYSNKVCIEGMSAHESKIGVRTPTTAKVDWKRSGHDRVDVFIESNEKSMLVLTDTYFPGWKAFLDDGVEIRIHPADIMFKAAAVPAGKHKVSFIYLPVSFKLGLWTTIVSLLTMIAAHSRWKRKSRIEGQIIANE